jgi:hypothetical protein
MLEAPSYVIVGRGRWARRVNDVLAAEARGVTVLSNPRRQPDEGEDAYAERIGSAFRSADAQVAWLCVPPGPHVPVLVSVALSSGLHVIAEKPWRYPLETEQLESLARAAGRLVGVDFEYCLLDGVRRWMVDFGTGQGLRFGGEFVVSSPNRLGISPVDNLAGHLLAIAQFAVPAADLGDIYCGYERPAARRVWLDGSDGRVSEIDFGDSTEPILQRYVATFEAALDGAALPFDLPFARSVAHLSAALEARPLGVNVMPR